MMYWVWFLGLLMWGWWVGFTAAWHKASTESQNCHRHGIICLWWFDRGTWWGCGSVDSCWVIQSFAGPGTLLFMEPQPFMPGCVYCSLFWGEFNFHWNFKGYLRMSVRFCEGCLWQRMKLWTIAVSFCSWDWFSLKQAQEVFSRSIRTCPHENSLLWSWRASWN